MVGRSLFLFQALQRRLRKTVVFVTHDINEALSLGDRIGLLENGKLRTLGTAEEFLNSSDEEAKRYVEVFRSGSPARRE